MRYQLSCQMKAKWATKKKTEKPRHYRHVDLWAHHLNGRSRVEVYHLFCVQYALDLTPYPLLACRIARCTAQVLFAHLTATGDKSCDAELHVYAFFKNPG